jgi:uncharacterized membrane protein
MIQIEKSIVIYRPVEQVFAYLTALDNGARWQSGVVEETKLTPGPVSLGTQFHNVTEFLGRRLESTLEVTEFEPGKAFGFRSISAPFPTRMIHRYEAVPGGTLLTIVAQADPGGIYKFAQAFAARHAGQKLETDLKNLKRILESEKNAKENA